MTAARLSPALTIFKRLAADAAGADLSALEREVRQHHESLVKAQVRSELIALDLAEQLTDRLVVLLRAAAQLSPDERALIAGAARYFIADDDSRPDAASATGLDDDVEVFNHVASALGRPDLLIVDG